MKITNELIRVIFQSIGDDIKLLEKYFSYVRKGKNLGLALVIEFESIKTARKFYESEKYQAAKATRELAANTHLILVEGSEVILTK